MRTIIVPTLSYLVYKIMESRKWIELCRMYKRLERGYKAKTLHQKVKLEFLSYVYVLIFVWLNKAGENVYKYISHMQKSYIYIRSYHKKCFVFLMYSISSLTFKLKTTHLICKAFWRIQFELVLTQPKKMNSTC